MNFNLTFVISNFRTAEHSTDITFQKILEEMKSETDISIKGHHLIEISKRLRKRDLKFFNSDNDMELLFLVLTGKIDVFIAFKNILLLSSKRERRVRHHFAHITSKFLH